jgi:LysM repeat protein
MNRKDTILVAVLINAGVLVVLFTSALKNKQADLVIQHSDTVPVIEQKIETASLVKDDLELAIERAKLQEQATEAVPQAPQEVAASVSVSPIAQEPSFIEVSVKQGDFLAKIAKRYQVSVEDIMRVNALKNTNLKIGQVLKIPQGVKSLAPVVAASSDQTPAGVKFYTIKSGDNPWTIAQKHKMKVEELLDLNHLTKEKAKSLKVGDKLKVKA